MDHENLKVFLRTHRTYVTTQAKNQKFMGPKRKTFLRT